MSKQKQLLIKLTQEEYELLARKKGLLTWKQLLFRVAREKAWRIEELEYHLGRIISIFPEAREVLEEAKRKILKLMRD